MVVYVLRYIGDHLGGCVLRYLGGHLGGCVCIEVLNWSFRWLCMY